MTTDMFKVGDRVRLRPDLFNDRRELIVKQVYADVLVCNVISNVSYSHDYVCQPDEIDLIQP